MNKRLEHDREVIPERLQASTAEHAVQALSDMPIASVGAPPVRGDDRLLADVLRAACSICSAVIG